MRGPGICCRHPLPPLTQLSADGLGRRLTSDQMGALRLWADSLSFLPLARPCHDGLWLSSRHDQKTTVRALRNSGKSKLACPSILWACTWGLRFCSSLLQMLPATTAPWPPPGPRAGGLVLIVNCFATSPSDCVHLTNSYINLGWGLVVEGTQIAARISPGANPPRNTGASVSLKYSLPGRSHWPAAPTQGCDLTPAQGKPNQGQASQAKHSCCCGDSAGSPPSQVLLFSIEEVDAGMIR